MFVDNLLVKFLCKKKKITFLKNNFNMIEPLVSVSLQHNLKVTQGRQPCRVTKPPVNLITHNMDKTKTSIDLK